MLFEFFEKLIIMWSLIRPCWVDFSSKLNRHVDMIIRATRVLNLVHFGFDIDLGNLFVVQYYSGCNSLYSLRVAGLVRHLDGVGFGMVFY